MNKILQIGVMACVLMSQIDSVHAGLFGASTLKGALPEAQNIYSEDYQPIIKELKTYKTNVDKIQKIIAQLGTAGKKGNDALTKEFASKMETQAPNVAFCVSLMALTNQYNALATYLSKAVARLSTAINSFAKTKKTTDLVAQGKIIIECAERFRAAAYIGKFSSESLRSFVDISSELSGAPIIGHDALNAALAKTTELGTFIDNLATSSEQLKGYFSKFQMGSTVHIDDDCRVINASLDNLNNSFTAFLQFVEGFETMLNGEAGPTIEIPEYINPERKKVKILRRSPRSVIQEDEYDDD